MRRILKATAIIGIGALWSSLSLSSVIKDVAPGSTDVTVTIKIIDETDGTPETGVAFDTSGIDIEYWRHGPNTVTDITEATQTVNGAHTDGGFVHLGNGIYRLDLPDAAVAAGTGAVDVMGTVTGMIVIGGTVQLGSPVVGLTTTDIVKGLGGHTTTIATLATQVSFTLTAGSADDDAYNGWAAYIEDVSTSTQIALGKVGDYTGTSRTVTLAADPNIFTIAATDNIVLLPAFLSDGVDVTLIEGVDATDQLDAHAAAGLDAAGVRSAVGLASANLDTQLGAIDDFVDTEVAAILVDTAEIGAAGAGLTAAGGDGSQFTAIDLPDQTMNITGNLSGSVGSVTAAVDVGTIETGDATDALEAAVTAALLSEIPAEPTAVPVWGVSPLSVWVAYMAAWYRNEVQQTATTKTLRNDADSADLITCGVSDNGTTFQVDECATAP